MEDRKIIEEIKNAPRFVFLNEKMWRHEFLIRRAKIKKHTKLIKHA